MLKGYFIKEIGWVQRGGGFFFYLHFSLYSLCNLSGGKWVERHACFISIVFYGVTSATLPTNPVPKQNMKVPDSTTAHETLYQKAPYWSQQLWKRRHCLSVCIWFHVEEHLERFVTMPSAPTSPLLTVQLFFDFCAIVPRVAPHFFSSARSGRVLKSLVRTHERQGKKHKSNQELS